MTFAFRPDTLVTAAPERPGLDVVVRVHDPARLDELSRAVFSIALQDYRPVTIHVVCQRFEAEALEAVRQTLTPLMTIAGDAGLELLNRPDPSPLDARAALLNHGLQAGRARYAAFLDYDDLIYPEGYRLLIGELEASGAAIAFGGILNAYVSRDGLVPVTKAKHHVFQGEGLSQLLHNNFCPLHSFVLDRRRIAAEDLVIDESLAALEDYDFLLRLCARYPSSFRLKDKIVGEYVLKDDHSNINPLAHPGQAEIAWEAANVELTARKGRLVLSRAIQGLLGVDEPGLTVAAFLDRQSALLEPPSATKQV